MSSERPGSPPRRIIALALLLALVGLSSTAEALNVIAVYRAACEREVGVILRVERRRIHLLKSSGAIAKIPRHEIVSPSHTRAGSSGLASACRASAAGYETTAMEAAG